jgi:adenosylhomocysteinase
MDMSFANQGMAAAHLAKHHASMKKEVYDVPLEIDEEVATLKLSSMGVEIDTLTPEQLKYMASWSEGT